VTDLVVAAHRQAEADRELLANFAVCELDHVFWVAVDADQAGDLDRDARLFHDLALHGLRERLAEFERAAGDGVQVVVGAADQ
jgi:hypothetical protein